VFIDDKKKNITAAERAGMIGILCQKPDQLQEYLERMLMFTAL
jgi:FMN phosphatase YigB (HAD superfamily)